jgi:murein DD-endopeptidase MepM/ murein hydrolase activator NlpD
MSKLNFSNSKVSKFLSSKGFYAAIALCLVGAGAATWLAVDRTVTGFELSNESYTQNEGALDFPMAEEAETKSEDVKEENAEPITAPAEQSDTSSASQASASASEQQSEPVIKLEELPVSENLPTLAYTLPVSGNIINPFSNGELVKNLTLGDWRTHDGIDIAAEKDADVYAAADGVVQEVRHDPLWGTTVTVDHHDGRQSIYAGLNNTVTVKAGDPVISKQTLGKVDGVPCEISDENHIHFAMKQEGKWIDPQTVFP